MSLIRKELIMKKKKDVSDITERVSDSKITIVSDYRGLSVPEITQLRQGIKQSGGKASVFKNTLIRFAFKSLDFSYPESMLKGPSLLITTNKDAVKVCKVLMSFIKEHSKGEVKGGVFDDKYVDDTVVKELSRLPGRDELVSKVISLIKGPLVGLVCGVRSPISGLINSLSEIKNKKQEV